MEIKVKYKINKKLDHEMALVFPHKKDNNIDEFYAKNKQLLKTKTIEFNKRWQLVSNDFVNAVKKLFPSYQIKKISSTGFISIFDRFSPCG